MLVKALAQCLAHSISSLCSYCHSSQKETPIMFSPFINAIYHDQHSAPSHNLALTFFFILFLCLLALQPTKWSSLVLGLSVGYRENSVSSGIR